MTEVTSFSRTPPAFLTLKRQYADRIKEKAISEFSARTYRSALARELEKEHKIDISTDTLGRLLNGARGRGENIQALCKYAGLDWQEATEEKPITATSKIPPKSSDINELVDRICKGVTFAFESQDHATSEKCEAHWLKNSFIDLDLVEVEYLPSKYPVPNREYLLNDSSKEDEFDRLGIRLLHGTKASSREIIKKFKNILVYGEPGSGKSSYLKWIALSCRDRVFLKEYVPLFMEVRSFYIEGTGQTLTTYFEAMFAKWGITQDELLSILTSGRGLFILDGADETNQSERYRILRMVRRLLLDYDGCRFILSSRLAFDLQLPQLQKVIISPFSSRKHIPDFIRNWFSQAGRDISKADSMLGKFKSPQYRAIREIARRPVLLKLLCILFDQSGEFPTKRADLFQTGISHLVHQTDGSMYTDIIDQPELKPRDIRNILCRIANYFFIDHEYLLLFHTRDVDRLIQDYYVSLYKADRNMVSGEHILVLIEQFNGLLVRWAQNFCAFSHLTFQEYFVAQHLVDRNEQTLVYDYLTHPRWPFIIELVSELLPKEKILDFFYGFRIHLDKLVNTDEKLRQFFEVLSRTASSASLANEQSHPFTQVLIRAWYLVYAIGEYTDKVDGNLPSLKKFNLPDMTYATSMISNHVLDLHQVLYDAYHCTDKEDSAKFKTLIGKLIKLLRRKDPQKVSTLESWLTQMDSQLAQYNNNRDAWWQEDRIRSNWKISISRLMDRLGLPHIHGLTNEQISLLKKYYTATYLFSNCMVCSAIKDDKRSELANAMLLLMHLPPDDFVGFNDFPSF